MAEVFGLPAVGDTMTEAEIVEWFVDVGDVVEVDQPICSLETDKSVVEMTTPFAGTVLSLGGDTGDVIEVGETLIVVGQSHERVLDEPLLSESPWSDHYRSRSSEPSSNESLSDRRSRGSELPLSESSSDHRRSRSSEPSLSRQELRDSEPLSSELQADRDLSDGGVLAMPKARKLARDSSINLAAVAGTGPHGSVTVDDINRYASQSTHPALASQSTSHSQHREITSAIRPQHQERTFAARPQHRERMSATRRAIAARLTESVRRIPQFVAMLEVDASALFATRSALIERLGKPVPLDAILMLLTIPVLRDHPKMNAAVDGDEIIFYDCFDIGVAVDTPDGLVVPVVRDVDTRSVSDLASEVVRLTAAARDRTISPLDLTGATCTVNNVGAVGIVAGTPILPLGTSTVVAFGLARPVVRLTNGVAVEVPTITISATFDHRLIDGGDAGRFLTQLRRHLEVPAAGLL